MPDFADEGRSRILGPPSSSRLAAMGPLRVSEFLHGPADVAGHISERLVSVGPIGHRSPVGRDRLKLPERGGVPTIDVPQDDRDDTGLFRFMPLHGPPDL